MKKIRYYSHVTPGYDPARGSFSPKTQPGTRSDKPQKRGKR